MKRQRILLIDASSYRRVSRSEYAPVLAARIGAETLIERGRLGFAQRGAFPYSRGLLQVASAAQAQGHVTEYVSVFDDGFERALPDRVRQAQILGISCVTASYEVMRTLTLLSRNVNPSLTIVVGGPHVTHNASATLRDVPDIDVIVTGEGCARFADLLATLAADRVPPRAMPPVHSGNPDSRLRETGSSPIHPVLPAYNLLGRPFERYAHNVLTQTGCRHRCKYCASAATPLSYYDLDSVMAEIKYLEARLPSNYLLYIADDVIASDRRRLFDLCRRIERETRQLYFVCELRADNVDRDVIRALWGARFVQFNIGFEDSEDGRLHNLGREVSFTVACEACELIRSTTDGLIGAHWVTGLPGSTRKSLENNTTAVEQLVGDGLVDILSNKIFVPYPGTTVYEHRKRYGITLRPVSWSEYDRLSPPVFDLECLTSEEIWGWFIHTEQAIVASYAKRLGITADRLRRPCGAPLHSHHAMPYLDGGNHQW